MRCLTVSQAKLMGKHRGARPLQDAPREGTFIRRAYDMFKQHPGLPIEFSLIGTPDPCVTRKLIDFYGLDIRMLQKGSSKVQRPSIYVLAGEWFGRVYVDYIEERMEHQS